MTGSGTELQRAGEVLGQARQVRDALGAGQQADPSFGEHATSVISELIEITESLLAERQAYESRLHRSPVRGVVTSEFGENP